MFQHLQKLKQGQPVGWVERYWNQQNMGRWREVGWFSTDCYHVFFYL